MSRYMRQGWEKRGITHCRKIVPACCCLFIDNGLSVSAGPTVQSLGFTQGFVTSPSLSARTLFVLVLGEAAYFFTLITCGCVTPFNPSCPNSIPQPERLLPPKGTIG